MMTWDELQDALYEAIKSGTIIAVVQSQSNGQELLYIHCEHATPQQLQDRLTLDEVGAFWARHPDR